MLNGTVFYVVHMHMAIQISASMHTATMIALSKCLSLQ